jgi:hypothetical protein
MTEQSDVPHEPDRMPTPEEEAAAERADADADDVREAYEAATERGARQEGEGKPGV